MTDEIKGVARLAELERRNEHHENEQKKRNHNHSARHASDEEQSADDTVEISDEARKRASGKWHKSILEHLEGK